MVRPRSRNIALFLSALLFILSFWILLPAPAASASANPVVVRGLFVGCGDYEDELNDLAPDTYNDANECCYVFSNAYYDNVSRVKGKMSIATDIRQSTLTRRLNPSGSSSIFYGADANDVSVFYFSGHGTDYDDYGRPAIVLSDGNTDDLMSVDALQTALHKIPGTKIVILDSCFSGAFIGKSYTRDTSLNPYTNDASPSPYSDGTSASEATPSPTPVPPTQTELEEFAQAMVQPFAQADKTARALLSRQEYIVFTASSGYDYSYSEGEGADSMGCFTRSFTDGLGRLGRYAADADTDRTITADEAYDSAVDLYDEHYGDDLGKSTAQVYPKNSSFSLMRYRKNGAVASGTMKYNTIAYTSTLAGKSPLGILTAGTPVKVYGALGNYYKVSSGDTYGYVYKGNVTLVTGTVGKPGLGVGKAKKKTYVYTSASTSAKKLLTLSTGRRMNIIGVWGQYYIVSVSGVNGCVPAGTVTVVSGSVGPAPASKYVLAVGNPTKSTYVYQKASLSGTKVRAIGPKSKVTITAVLPDYYKVWAYGNVGYMLRSDVAIVSGTLRGRTPKSVSTTINARAEARQKCLIYASGTTISTKLGTLNAGGHICVLRVKGNFYKVLYKGKYGYVLAKNLRILTPAYFTGAGEARYKCSVYKYRSTGSTKKLTLQPGGRMSILGVYGNFYKVRVSGVSGYMAVKNVKVL